MTSVPIGSNIGDSFKAGHGLPFDSILDSKYGPRLRARGQRMFSQFEGAEITAETYGVTKEGQSYLHTLSESYQRLRFR